MTIRSWKNHLLYVLLLMPALLLFTLFFLVPFFRSLHYSFTDLYGYNTEYQFIGFNNYVNALTDENFLNTLVVTLQYTGFVVLIGNMLALGLALIADSTILGNRALRSLFFIPNLMSLIIVGFVWTFLYGAVYPSILEWFGNPESLWVSWLGDTRIAIYSVGLAAVWQSAGYTMIIYLAGLQNISTDVIEAATIDGASAKAVFWRIKIPLLSPVIMMNLILTATTSLKAFDFPLAMTSGGPGQATTTIAYYIYILGFKSLRTGYATAVSILLFLIIAVFTLAFVKIMRIREEKQ